ncbi:transcriptional regulator of AraC family [alpha proteobacterium U9-1i]|nr:transcriptional regulator of AraC family [alpha proteobacterium U9-1i]
MDAINKALWFIESRLTGPLSMEDVAENAGASRFHLSRLFALTLGRSAIGYVRGRRLSEAARQLGAGAPDILSVALDHGYGSHEAFTRAFREQFGLTPEAFRADGDLSKLALVEPIRMTNAPANNIDVTRYEDAPAFLMAGLGARYKQGGDPAIPGQWMRFNAHIGHVSHQVGDVAYGVICNFDEDGAFDYICAVEVSRFADLPPEFQTIRVPARRYAVFTHRGHISKIPATLHAVWAVWLPASGKKPADAPSLERYDARFNATTGEGDVEFWLPLES